VCDGYNQDQLGLYRVQQAVGKMVKDFSPDAVPNVGCGIRIFGNERDAPMNLGNEPEPDLTRLVLVIPIRLAELFIGLGKELGIHKMSAIARLNTFSAGMPWTLPSRNSCSRRSASCNQRRSTSDSVGSSRNSL